MTTQPSDESLVLTVAQAAKLLQVSQNTLYSLIAQGVVPHVRYGKLIRIPQWALLQSIAAASGAPAPLTTDVAIQPTTSVHVQQQSEEG